MASKKYPVVKTTGLIDTSNVVNTANFQPSPNVDAFYGPYESLSEAHERCVTGGCNVIGKTVGVILNGVIDEYWYKEGTTQEHLVLKIVAKSSSIVYLQVYKITDSATDCPRPVEEKDIPTGWSDVPSNPLANEYLWTTRARKIDGEFLTWSNSYIWQSPICISSTSDSGSDVGADSETLNFIYKRTSSNVNPGRPTFTVAEIEAADADGIYGWTDHPSGVSIEYPYEWISIATITSEGNTQWSMPALWSKYGFNGVDGDGIEYIFTRTTDLVIPDTPIAPDKTRKLKLSIPAGWYADPRGVNTTYPYEWVSIRRSSWSKTEDTSYWEDYSDPALWATFLSATASSIDYINIYKSVNIEDTIDRPMSELYPPAGWSKTPTPVGATQYLYMSQARKDLDTFLTWDNTQYIWSIPVRLSGEPGAAGVGYDGSDINYVYYLDIDNTGERPSKPQFLPSAIESVPSNVGIDGWKDNPSGVTSYYLYEWISISTKPAASKENPNPGWSNWTEPVLWSRYGSNGMDGDGVEYIFKLTDTHDRPSTPVAQDKYGFTDEDIPDGWTDDPQDVTAAAPYEWVSIRRKTWDEKKKKSYWGPYGKATLWATFLTGREGKSVWTIYNDSFEDLSGTRPDTDNWGKQGWHSNWTSSIVWMSMKIDDSLTGNVEWGYPIKLRGESGTSISIKGRFSTLLALNNALNSGEINPELGDAYVVESDGHLYIYNGNALNPWTDVGVFKGDPGQSSYIHIKYSNNINDHIFNPPIEWSDEEEKIVANISTFGETPGDYMGIKADNNQEDPIEWNAYEWIRIKGEKGEDGNQYQRIFVRTEGADKPDDDSEIIEFETLNNYDTQTVEEELVPSIYGYTDDPQGVDEIHQYEWIREREWSNGHWSRYGKATLWTKWGADGAKGEDGEYEEHAYFVTGDIELEGNIYSGKQYSLLRCALSIPAIQENDYVPDYYAVLNDDETEYSLYAYTTTSGSVIGYNSIGQSFTPSNDVLERATHVTWTDNPSGITGEENSKVEWIVTRHKSNETVGSEIKSLWSKFSSVVPWSRYGKDGRDGDGIEYIYTTSLRTLGIPYNPTPSDWNAPTSIYQTCQTEYIPGTTLKGYLLDYKVQGGNVYLDRTWYDDPLEISFNNPTLYVCRRKRTNGVWEKFSDPVIWNKIYNSYTISLTNDNAGLPAYSDGTYTETAALKATKTEIRVYNNGNILYPGTDYTISVGTLAEHVVITYNTECYTAYLKPAEALYNQDSFEIVFTATILSDSTKLSKVLNVTKSFGVSRLQLLCAPDSIIKYYDGTYSSDTINIKLIDLNLDGCVSNPEGFLIRVGTSEDTADTVTNIDTNYPLSVTSFTENFYIFAYRKVTNSQGISSYLLEDQELILIIDYSLIKGKDGAGYTVNLTNDTVNLPQGTSLEWVRLLTRCTFEVRYGSNIVQPFAYSISARDENGAILIFKESGNTYFETTDGSVSGLLGTLNGYWYVNLELLNSAIITVTIWIQDTNETSDTYGNVITLTKTLTISIVEAGATTYELWPSAQAIIYNPESKSCDIDTISLKVKLFSGDIGSNNYSLGENDYITYTVNNSEEYRITGLVITTDDIKVYNGSTTTYTTVQKLMETNASLSLVFKLYINGAERDQEEIKIFCSGKTGVSVDNVNEYYYAASFDKETQSLKLPAKNSESWLNYIPSNFNEENPYLWNYEETVYSDPTKETTTTAPGVIAVWSKDGKSIGTIIEMYATSTSANIENPKDTLTWTEQIIPDDYSELRPYLWNYEIVYFEDDTVCNETNAALISTWGRTGSDAYTVDLSQEVAPIVVGTTLAAQLKEATYSTISVFKSGNQIPCGEESGYPCFTIMPDSANKTQGIFYTVDTDHKDSFYVTGIDYDFQVYSCPVIVYIWSAAGKYTTVKKTLSVLILNGFAYDLMITSSKALVFDSAEESSVNFNVKVLKRSTVVEDTVTLETLKSFSDENLKILVLEVGKSDTPVEITIGQTNDSVEKSITITKNIKSLKFILYKENVYLDSETLLISRNGREGYEVGENIIDGTLRTVTINTISGTSYYDTGLFVPSEAIGREVSFSAHVVVSGITLSNSELYQFRFKSDATHWGTDIKFSDVYYMNTTGVYEVTGTTTIPNYCTGDCPIYLFINGEGWNGATFTISKLKMEYGSHSTSWNISENDKMPLIYLLCPSTTTILCAWNETTLVYLINSSVSCTVTLRKGSYTQTNISYGNIYYQLDGTGTYYSISSGTEIPLPSTSDAGKITTTTKSIVFYLYDIEKNTTGARLLDKLTIQIILGSSNTPQYYIVPSVTALGTDWDETNNRYVFSANNNTTIKVSATKIKSLSGTTGSSTDHSLWYIIDAPSTLSDSTILTKTSNGQEIDVTTTNGNITFYLFLGWTSNENGYQASYSSIYEVSSNCLDSYTIPVVLSGKKGEKGDANVTITIDNQLDSVGLTTSGSVYTTTDLQFCVNMYYGLVAQTITNIYLSRVNGRELTEFPTGISYKSTPVVGTDSGVTVDLLIASGTTFDKCTLTFTAVSSAYGSKDVTFSIQGIRLGSVGASSLMADLSNEMDSVAMTYENVCAAEIILYTDASIYIGATELDIQSISLEKVNGTAITPVTVTSGTTISNLGGITGVTYLMSYNSTTKIASMSFTVGTTWAPTTLKTTYTFKITCSGGSEEVTFTILGVPAGAPGSSPTQYWLTTSTSLVKISLSGEENTETWSADKVSACRMEKTGSSDSIESTTGSLWYNLDNSSNYSSTTNNTLIDISSCSSNITFYFFQGSSLTTTYTSLASLKAACGILLDTETIPIVRDGVFGKEGLSVFASYHDGDTKPEKPTGAGLSDGWDDDVTANTVWVSFKTAYSRTDSDTTYPWGSPIRLRGTDGTSINLIDSVNSESDLPTGSSANNKLGDCYSVNGVLYVWNGSSWKNCGSIKGEQGTSQYIHIKYSDNGSTFTAQSDPNDEKTVGETLGKYIGIYVDENAEDDYQHPDKYKPWCRLMADDGISNFKLDLSNEMDAVLVNASGLATSNNTILTKYSVYYGATDITSSITNLDIEYTYSDPGKISATASGQDITVTVSKDATVNPRASVTILLTGKYGELDIDITTMLMILGLTGGVIYQLAPSVTAIKIDKTGTYLTNSFYCGVNQIVGNTTLPYSGAEVSLKYSIDDGTEKSYVNSSTINTVSTVKDTVSGNLVKPIKYVDFYLYKNGNVIDRETIPVVSDGEKGEDGSGITVNLTNASSSVPPGSTAAIISQRTRCTFEIRDGLTIKTPNSFSLEGYWDDGSLINDSLIVKETGEPYYYGATAVGNKYNGYWYLNSTMDKGATITLTAYFDNNVTFSKTLTISITEEGADSFELYPSTTSIIYNSSSETFDLSTITFKVFKYTQTAGSEYTVSNTDGDYIKYRLSTETEATRHSITTGTTFLLSTISSTLKTAVAAGNTVDIYFYFYKRNESVYRDMLPVKVFTAGSNGSDAYTVDLSQEVAPVTKGMASTALQNATRSTVTVATGSSTLGMVSGVYPYFTLTKGSASDGASFEISSSSFYCTSLDYTKGEIFNVPVKVKIFESSSKSFEVIKTLSVQVKNSDIVYDLKITTSGNLSRTYTDTTNITFTISVILRSSTSTTTLSKLKEIAGIGTILYSTNGSSTLSNLTSFSSTSTSATTLTISPLAGSNANCIKEVYFELKDSAGNYLDGETFTITRSGDKGDSGKSSLVANLTSDSGMISMDNEGKALGAYTLSTKLELYYGLTGPVTLDALPSYAPTTLPTGVSISSRNTDGSIGISVAKNTTLTDDKCEITFTGTYTVDGSAKSLSCVYTIKGIRNGKDGIIEGLSEEQLAALKPAYFLSVDNDTITIDCDYGSSATTTSINNILSYSTTATYTLWCGGEDIGPTSSATNKGSLLITKCYLPAELGICFNSYLYKPQSSSSTGTFTSVKRKTTASSGETTDTGNTSKLLLSGTDNFNLLMYTTATKITKGTYFIEVTGYDKNGTVQATKKIHIFVKELSGYSYRLDTSVDAVIWNSTKDAIVSGSSITITALKLNSNGSSRIPFLNASTTVPSTGTAGKYYLYSPRTITLTAGATGATLAVANDSYGDGTGFDILLYYAVTNNSIVLVDSEHVDFITNGGAGSKGDTGTTYYLSPSVSVIKKSGTTYTPNTITCSKLASVNGATATSTSDGKIWYKKDSDSTPTEYSSGLTLSSVAPTTCINFYFTLASGTTASNAISNAILVLSVPVLSDGASGSSPVVASCSVSEGSYYGLVGASSARTCIKESTFTTSMSLFKGATKLTITTISAKIVKSATPPTADSTGYSGASAIVTTNITVGTSNAPTITVSTKKGLTYGTSDCFYLIFEVKAGTSATGYAVLKMSMKSPTFKLTSNPLFVSVNSDGTKVYNSNGVDIYSWISYDGEAFSSFTESSTSGYTLYCGTSTVSNSSSSTYTKTDFSNGYVNLSLANLLADSIKLTPGGLFGFALYYNASNTLLTKLTVPALLNPLGGSVIRYRGDFLTVIDGTVSGSYVYFNIKPTFYFQSSANATTDGVTYIDVVSYDGNYYQCKKSYTLGLYSNGTYTANGGTYTYRIQTTVTTSTKATPNKDTTNWEAANYSGFVATKLLMSESAAFEVASSGSLVVKKSDGTIVAGMTGVNASTSPVIWAGSTTASTSSPFYVKADGSLHATSGDIGGWTIGTSDLHSGPTSVSAEVAGTYIGTNGFNNWASSNSYTRITGGLLTTNNISISGGSLSGWTLNSSAIYNSTSSLATTSSHSAGTYIGTSGISNSNGTNYTILASGNITTNNIIASGGSIGGWKINSYSIYFEGTKITDGTFTKLSFKPGILLSSSSAAYGITVSGTESYVSKGTTYVIGTKQRCVINKDGVSTEKVNTTYTKSTGLEYTSVVPTTTITNLLNIDGSGLLASGNILWTTSGDVTIKSLVSSSRYSITTFNQYGLEINRDTADSRYGHFYGKYNSVEAYDGTTTGISQYIFSATNTGFKISKNGSDLTSTATTEAGAAYETIGSKGTTYIPYFYISGGLTNSNAQFRLEIHSNKIIIKTVGGSTASPVWVNDTVIGREFVGSESDWTGLGSTGQAEYTKAYII